jgi:hypothetical protein
MPIKLTNYEKQIKSTDFEVSVNIFKSFMGIAITTFRN